MGFFSFLDPALNFIFGPLLSLPAFWAILIMSFLISLIIVLIYKFATNQNLMKQLKDEIKTLQKQAKELKHEPEKAMAVQKKAMQTNMKYMMQSMKATLLTFIPIIIIFGWLQGHFAFMPILPDQDFTMTLDFEDGAKGNVSVSVPEGIEVIGDKSRTVEDSQVIFGFRGKKGVYDSPPVEFSFDDKEYEKEVIITSGKEYVEPVKRISDDNIESITTSNEKNVVMNLFGWKLGWLGSYIIFALVFSLALRKLMKVY
ncbi:DUF106 domain-containing protein [Candidatus Woesearchaeota archaeon]|nr:DUF106 domain-containing protein [Candidatus Woesearchaeota archaeon]